MSARKLSAGSSTGRTPQELGLDIPFFADKAAAYPLPLIVTFAAIMAMLVFIWEVLWLRSTLCGRHTLRMMKDISQQMKDYVASVLQEDSEDEEAEEEKKADTKVQPWSKADHERFWGEITTLATRTPDTVAEDPKVSEKQIDIVGFAKREFLGNEADGRLKITVVRSGPCTEELEVTVDVRESSYKSIFKAVAGKEFEAMEAKKLKFPANEKIQSFDVRLYKDTGGWQPSRYFIVEMTSVSSPNAVLGGPSIHSMKKGTKKDAKGPIVRAFIAQATNFPQEKNKYPLGTMGDLRLVWSYIMERKKARGKKWWLTLVAMLFVPFNDIVVRTVAEKFLLDHACVPAGSGFNNYWAIAGVGLVMVVSLVLQRWGSAIVTRNRGRTGGCRMKARIDILSKLMNLDHEEQLKIPRSRWLYTALVDVDTMVVQGYWQGFSMCQNIFALFLSVAVLFLASLYKAMLKSSAFKARNFVDTIGILILTPLSFFIIWKRESTTSEHLEQRQELEQHWVDTLATLAQNSRCIHAIGMKDLSVVESDFEKESQHFVKHHQAARDLLADTQWVTRWLTGVFYIFMVLYSGFRLYDSLATGDSAMTAGDLVLVLKVYASFGKYLAKVNGSIVGMMKAAVSLRRVARLLDAKEFTHLKTAIDPEVISLDSRVERKIVFKNTAVDLQGQGFVLTTKRGVVPEIRLGSFVCVENGSLGENAGVGFMKMAAKLLTPSVGEVQYGTPGLVVFVPLIPFEVRHNTIVMRLMFAGISYHLAVRAAEALGWNPERRCDSMLTGETKLMEIFCAMLRDPEVLILDRPLCLLPADSQTKLACLFRVWQAHGGARGILRHLTGGLEEHDVTDLNPLLQQRTLIIGTRDMDDHAQATDVIFKLDENFEVRVAALGKQATT